MKSVKIFFLLINYLKFLKSAATLSNELNFITACGINEYECLDKECIKLNFLCDGVKHCADGSDEDERTCSPDINCETSPFGCCSDNLTPALGPLKEGCCLNSAYGCCPDNVNEAKGLHFEGCTCTTSKFGCCPDGIAEAQGNKFEGCKNVLTLPQKVCSLNRDVGTCNNYTLKYFFDTEYGGCSRFWYGGCDGNDNRFESEDECKATCVEPSAKNICHLPKIHGPCTGFYPMWHYDTDKNTCAQFIYGGCLGNANRFEKIEDCQALCDVDDEGLILTTNEPVVKDQCHLPADTGSCENYSTLWYFETKLKRCRRFYYGGCGGNENRFNSKDECDQMCKQSDENPVTTTQAPQTRPPTQQSEAPTSAPTRQPIARQKNHCLLPYKTGFCGERIRRFYYDSNYGICSQFAYSGCDGNENNFETQQECEELCDDSVDLCDLAPLAEGCEENMTRWYYDSYMSRCEQFTFTGCYGNKNNFEDQRSCELACQHRQRPTESLASRTQTPSENTEQCRQPAEDSGDCDDWVIRYSFITGDKSCKSFYYGGCGGSDNRFESIEECESRCLNIPHQDEDTKAPEEPEENCDQFKRQCGTLLCAYGVLKSFDASSGCEICSCENPCERHECPQDTKCSVDVSAAASGETVFVAVCRQHIKAGRCPNIDENFEECERECYYDADCRGDHKCCVSGCSQICTAPRTDQERQTVLQKVSEEDLQPVASEGGVATLRCFATGFPPPSISWKKGGLELKTNQGHYILTANGDLQIVQLHRTDAGTYVCVAYNGIAKSVQREIVLTVDEPVEGGAYIVGEPNSTVIGLLGQPAVIRCPAGGNPKPFMTWWRDDKILPFIDDRFEITPDNSLVFSKLELFDLGPYVCQAFNSIGRPVSITVTLKARGSARPQNEDDRRFLQYIVTGAAHQERPIFVLPTPTQATRRPPQTPHIPQEDFKPVTANIVLKHGRTFKVGSEIHLYCNVTGEPLPEVKWFKNLREFEPSNHIEFLDDNTLFINDAQSHDSGNYRCVAQNSYSQASANEVISIEGIDVPSDCEDNKLFANCRLIVKGYYCNHKYYEKFCCRSCTLAGQIYYGLISN